MSWILLIALAVGAPSPHGLTMDTVQSAADPYHMDGLLDSRDAPTTLSEQSQHRLLVVVVLKGTWCPVCQEQLMRLAARQDEIEALDARVVGLSIGRPAQHRDFLQRTAIPFEVVSDPDHRIVQAMGLWVPGWEHPLPSIVVYDRCGQEAGRQEGRNGLTRPEPSLFRLLRELAAQPTNCGDLVRAAGSAPSDGGG